MCQGVWVGGGEAHNVIQRRINADVTSLRCIDVNTALYKRHVPARVWYTTGCTSFIPAAATDLGQGYRLLYIWSGQFLCCPHFAVHKEKYIRLHISLLDGSHQALFSLIFLIIMPDTVIP